MLQYICLFSLIFSFVTTELQQENIRKQGKSSSIKESNVTLKENSSKILVNSTHSSHEISKQIVSEGGLISSTIETHRGREQVIESPVEKTVKNGTFFLQNATVGMIKPVHDKLANDDMETSPLHDQKIVPKKGVTFLPSDLPGTNKNTTVLASAKQEKNSTVRGKPLVTESDSDYIDITKSRENMSKEDNLKMDQIDPMLHDRSNSSDYIVPIVAVILSVPLVAILISVIYKRGADWWQHRNYKRMDFLIEGMYHN